MNVETSDNHSAGALRALRALRAANNTPFKSSCLMMCLSVWYISDSDCMLSALCSSERALDGRQGRHMQDEGSYHCGQVVMTGQHELTARDNVGAAVDLVAVQFARPWKSALLTMASTEIAWKFRTVASHLYNETRPSLAKMRTFGVESQRQVTVVVEIDRVQSSVTINCSVYVPGLRQ